MYLSKIALALICIMQIFANFSASAQANSIDPRQYIKVIYYPDHNQTKSGVVAYQSQGTNDSLQYPNSQRLFVLDDHGKLEIHFDIEALSSNPDWIGTISVNAEYDDNKVEVSPYSLVGEETKSFGVESTSPRYLAEQILNFRKAVQSVNLESFSAYKKKPAQILDELKNSIETANSTKDLFESLSLSDSIKNTTTSSRIKEKLKNLNLYNIYGWSNLGLNYDMYYPYNYSEFIYKIFSLDTTKGPLSSSDTEYFKNYITIYTSHFEMFSPNEIVEEIEKNKTNNIKKAYTKTKEDLKLIVTYYDQISSSGEDSYDAFLSILNTDKTELESIINAINQILEINDTSSDAKESEKILENFNNELTTPIEKLQEINKSSRFFNRPQFLYMPTDWYSNYSTHDTEQDTLTKYLSKTIFKKLVFATIDLSKIKLSEDGSLHIYLNWKSNNLTSNSLSETNLEIGKYTIKQTGCTFEIADSFMLIERINESFGDNQTLSPSNFKAAAGASMLWTFKSSDPYFSQNSWQKLVNKLQPSIGVNVSYLDFSTQKDFEIGTGVVLGLFDNNIFFGVGTNLHSLRNITIQNPLNESANYFSIGFSFAKLSDRIRNDND